MNNQGCNDVVNFEMLQCQKVSMSATCDRFKQQVFQEKKKKCFFRLFVF